MSLQTGVDELTSNSDAASDPTSQKSEVLIHWQFERILDLPLSSDKNTPQ